jgi:hypothetical protein
MLCRIGNRITQAKTVSTSSYCWGETYTIDAWGNLTGRTNIGGSGCVSEGNLSYSVNANNQFTSGGVQYDIAGNVMNDGNGNQPTYDAENTMATDAGVTYSFEDCRNRSVCDQLPRGADRLIETTLADLNSSGEEPAGLLPWARAIIRQNIIAGTAITVSRTRFWLA